MGAQNVSAPVCFVLDTAQPLNTYAWHRGFSHRTSVAGDDQVFVHRASACDFEFQNAKIRFGLSKTLQLWGLAVG